jgi:hypothetical protein
MNARLKSANPGQRRAATLSVLAVVITLTGCPGMGRRDAHGLAPGAAGRLSAPSDTPEISIERDFTPSDTGCRIATTRFQPRQPHTAVPVILAHGFLRDQRRMADLARALAGHGIPTVTLNFCNARPWDGGHIQNGLDMIAVARRQGASRVIYAGFSAGGLAALIAGRLDPQSVGVLALDLVDNRGIGVGMARTLDPPLIGLAGAPAACNARNNARALFAAGPRARLTPIPGASHCDFESPTDWLCETLCRGVDAGSPARRRAIIDTAVAAVSQLLGLAQAPYPDHHL